MRKRLVLLRLVGVREGKVLCRWRAVTTGSVEYGVVNIG